MKAVRYKEDCDDECETCKSVDFETYKNFSIKEKDNETDKGSCRGKQAFDKFMSG